MPSSVIYFDDYVTSGDLLTLPGVQDSVTLAAYSMWHSTSGRVFVLANAQQGVSLYPGTIASSAGSSTIYMSSATVDGRLGIEGTVRNSNATGSAIYVLGASSYIHVLEDGKVLATGDDGKGIWLLSNSSGTFSEIVNDGVIYGNNPIVRQGAENVSIVNNGTIDIISGDSYTDFYGGWDVIINNGRMRGSILFGGGNDSYDGQLGVMSGRIYGGSGNDQMFGGSGNEYFDGEANDDTLLGYGGKDTLYGGTGSDRLEGGDDNDKVYGGDGDDTLKGDHGNDALSGGDGNDTLDGGLGADYLSGGTGSDRASYLNSSSGLKVNLGTASQNTGEAKGDTYNSIENLTGSNFNDSLLGSAGANRISGANGNDTINGMAGNDVIFGGSGNDRIYGHLGSDTLEGNAGSDTFIFHTALGATNIDTIADFNRAADTIELWNDVFTVLSTGALAASAFKDMAVSAKDASDRIIYNSDTGILYYDADGSGTAYGNVKFAVLTGKPDITASDFVVV